MATWTVDTAGECFSLFKVYFVDAARLQLIDWDDLDEAVYMSNHSILALLRRRRNETNRTQSVLRERVNEVKHARCE